MEATIVLDAVGDGVAANVGRGCEEDGSLLANASECLRELVGCNDEYGGGFVISVIDREMGSDDVEQPMKPRPPLHSQS
ncbi:unnamed protein product [Angiostrongylus costaricensis]|uniref:Uncharacterized protein n=1 Tax=Angiostrongylus costaricensis TaxID=334426 RepID=A0A0R3PIB9_ANGCS|nr:unnamed protein product [Angiostrongylus costaricensis]